MVPLRRLGVLRELDYGPAAFGVACDPGTMLAAGSLALGAVGTGIAAAGTIAGGNAQQVAGQIAATSAVTGSKITSEAQLEGGRLQQQESEFTAGELDQNATQVRAQAQRQALDTRLQTSLAENSLVARAAGSGLAASGSTPIALMGDIAKRGEYIALSHMAAGENQARGIEDEATAARFSGAAALYGSQLQARATLYGGQAQAAADLVGGEGAKVASTYSASGTIASGAGSLLKTYGQFAYPTTTGRPGAG